MSGPDKRSAVLLDDQRRVRESSDALIGERQLCGTRSAHYKELVYLKKPHEKVARNHTSHTVEFQVNETHQHVGFGEN